MDHEEQKASGDLGDWIGKAVSDILDTMNFGQLNQVIGDTVDLALEEAAKRTKAYKPGHRRKDAPMSIRVKWKGRLSGILFAILGGMGTGIFGLMTLLFLIVMAVCFQDPMGWCLTALFGMLAAGSLVMLAAGIRQNGRIGRLKRYVKELKVHGKPYCELQRLSTKCGKSLKYVRDDLKKMLNLGMLPDVRMDEEGTCLILNEETYRQYETTQKEYKRKQSEQQKEEAPYGTKSIAAADMVKETEEEGAAAAAIRRGKQYMQTLDTLRQSLSGQQMEEKLLRTDMILERLFEALRKHPEQLDEMEKFMEYYLPTTVKLVTAYQEFSAVEVPGENITSARQEIEKTMDTINGAFEKLLDDLYEDAAMDVMTDASVLQTLLASEGLAGQDFDYDSAGQK